MHKNNPKVLIILSGKRKCGKDHIVNILIKSIQNFVVLRLSEPLKKEFAKINNLDFSELMTDSIYKESYRLKMVDWSNKIRKKDPNYFIKIAIEDKKAEKYPIWILADARRQGDIKFFKKNPEFIDSIIYIIRIESSEEFRKKRGYNFTKFIDDAETECGLDGFKDWSFILKNEDLTENEINKFFEPIIKYCNNIK